MKRLYAAVGAYDCGKTTTLQWLAERHGQRVHGEAHNQVVAELGERCAGHPEDQPWSPVTDPQHLCAICRPLEFGTRVLQRQWVIEQGAGDGDLLDHGWLDAVDYVRQRTTPDESARLLVPRFEPYACVFLFELMPELQRARWGKPVEQRCREAAAANERLAGLYVDHGMRVVRIVPGDVGERAAAVLRGISST